MGASIKAHDGKVKIIDPTSVVSTSKLPPKKTDGDVCIGRSCGRLTTNMHLRFIGYIVPVKIALLPGQMHDAPMAELLLNDLPRAHI